MLSFIQLASIAALLANSAFALPQQSAGRSRWNGHERPGRPQHPNRQEPGTCTLPPNGSTSFNTEQVSELCKMLDARDAWVTREGTQLRLNGQPWTMAGANAYWLGLDENVIPEAGEPFYEPRYASYPTKGRVVEAMNILNTMGALTVRSQSLGVSVGTPLSVMPELGVINHDAFEAIDWAIYQAREHGLRVIMPLIDNYDYYHGGKFTFLRWRGIDIDTSSGYSNLPEAVNEFYTNPTIIADFKNYITHLLTHTNPYTSLNYAYDPTVAFIETGNELSGPIFGDINVPNSWTNEILSHVRSLAPHTLLMDGTYGINATHFDMPIVDVYTDHFYPLNLTKLAEGVEKVQSTNRVYFAGETDVSGNRIPDPPNSVSLADFDAAGEAYVASGTNSAFAGDSFWSLFGRNVPKCDEWVEHDDGYTVSYGNPANTVQNKTQIAEVTRHLWALRGVQVEVSADSLPSVPCPVDV